MTLKRDPLAEQAWWRQAERVERLRQLWAEGLSGGAIGQRLGCSRNAVLGKARRLGLARRVPPVHSATCGCPECCAIVSPV